MSKYLKRFSEIPRLKLTAGERFCEDLSCQKARVGEGREPERALVDVTGLLPTIRHFENRPGEGPGEEVDFTKNFCRARKSLGTSLALQCYAALVSSGFLCSKVV